MQIRTLAVAIAAAMLILPAPAGAGTLTEHERDAALAHLAETRPRSLDSLAGVSAAQWTFKAAPERRSIAEVAEPGCPK